MLSASFLQEWKHHWLRPRQLPRFSRVLTACRCSWCCLFRPRPSRAMRFQKAESSKCKIKGCLGKRPKKGTSGTGITTLCQMPVTVLRTCRSIANAGKSTAVVSVTIFDKNATLKSTIQRRSNSWRRCTSLLLWMHLVPWEVRGGLWMPKQVL